MDIQDYHGTRTLCDADWCYFDHNDKLVRASSKRANQFQQYIGGGAWKDVADGWSARANFLMPGGDTCPIHYPEDFDALKSAIDGRAGG